MSEIINKRNKEEANSKLMEKIQHKLMPYPYDEKLDLLIDIANELQTMKSQDQFFCLLRERLKNLIKGEACFIALVDPDQTQYILHSLSSVADASELEQRYYQIDEGILGWVIKNGELMLDNIQNSPFFCHQIEGRLIELGLVSLLAVPIGKGEVAKGAIAVYSSGRYNLTQNDLTLFKIMSGYVNSALRYFSMVDRFDKRWSQIELINKIGRQLSSRLNLTDLLGLAVETVQKSFNYFDVTLFLVSRDRNEVVLEAHAGNFIDLVPQGFRLPIGKGIVGWVAQYGESVMVNDVSRDPRYIAYAHYKTNSELTVPIKVDGQVIGVLNIEDTKLNSFDQSDVFVLETLCDQLGIAIKNARLYEEIQQANFRLIELDKMKSDFLSIVSHDFRSPLSSAYLAAKALLRLEAAKQNDKIKKYLHLIIEQISRLSRLAEDTLSITRIESGRLSYAYKIVNVGRLIQDAISLVKTSANHKIEVSIEPNVIFIKADQPKLRQVIQNLLGNAIKYSPRGGTIKICVTEFSPDEVLFSISDQGIGIPVEYQSKLFDKFSRVPEGEAQNIKGTGLGLWICKEIIQGHKGRIWVESEYGKGSTFKFVVKKTSP